MNKHIRYPLFLYIKLKCSVVQKQICESPQKKQQLFVKQVFWGGKKTPIQLEQCRGASDCSSVEQHLVEKWLLLLRPEL